MHGDAEIQGHWPSEDRDPGAWGHLAALGSCGPTNGSATAACGAGTGLGGQPVFLRWERGPGQSESTREDDGGRSRNTTRGPEDQRTEYPALPAGPARGLGGPLGRQLPMTQTPGSGGGRVVRALGWGRPSQETGLLQPQEPWLAVVSSPSP